jgi:hypothetical protein
MSHEPCWKRDGRERISQKLNPVCLSNSSLCGHPISRRTPIYIYKYEARAGPAWSRLGWYDYNTKYIYRATD